LFSKLNKIFNKIKDLSGSVDKYKQDSIIQSLPTVAYVNKAKKLIEKRDYDQAEIVLNKALDISNQDATVYKYLGKIKEVHHDFEQAVTYYETSAKLNQNDKEIWLRLGMCLLNSNNLEESLSSFEKANKVTPLNTDVFTGWGMALMKQKKYALAKDKFIKAFEINKYNYTAILLTAIMEIRLCDYSSAEMKLEFLAKVAPNESSTYEYSRLKLLKSDYQAAETFAQKSIAFNRQMLPAYFVLGEVYSTLKNKDLTQKIFNAALENDLDCETLHFEWGKAYIRFFDYETAGTEFEKALEMKNDYLDAEIGCALVNSYKNDFNILDKVKEKNGSNVYIQEAQGVKCYSEEKFEDSIEFFKKALRTDPKQGYNYINLARCYVKLNDKSKVKDYYEKFITENPEYVQGFIEFAKWLISMNEVAEAQRKLRRAEKVDNDNLEIINLLFFTSYVLAKGNLCEYNIREAISIAQKAESLGGFEYKNEKAELEDILKNIQGN
jgi:tetratricopeptide (TPR) repeat protein